MEMSDGKSNKKGTPNKRWEEDMTIELISFLAEVVKSGSKPDKSFKKTQMHEAAEHINAKFRKAEMTWINVDSRLRTLKGWHKEIKRLFQLSGAGWDENTKMITLEEPVASTYLEAHKSAKQFVNKPLPYWEDLQLIMGDDAPTGRGAKSVYDDIGESGNEKDSGANLDDIMIDCTLGSDDFDGASESTPSSMKRPAVGTSSAFKPRRRRNDNNDIDWNGLIAGVKDIAHAVQAINVDYCTKLYDAVWAFEGSYPDDMLNRVFEHLDDNEREARRFLARRAEHKDQWLNDYFHKTYLGGSNVGDKDN